MSTESLARGSARHPRRVIALWGAAVLASAAISVLLLGSSLTSEDEVLADTDAGRAQELVEEHFPDRRIEQELVVVRSATLTVEDAAFVGALNRLSRGLAAEEAVVSPDGHAALLRFRLTGGALERAERLVADVREDRRLEAALYGAEIVERDFNRASKDDLAKGESFGAAAALVVLVLVFGTVVAAVVPLLLALVAIGVSLGAVALFGQAWELSIFVTNIVGGMGLALGIDYALFIVSRFREERAAGREPEDAIAAAGATASRAVLFSGVAVAVALLGIIFVPDRILRSLGIGATIAAVVSMLTALTLLPALLGLLGDRVNAWRVPVAGRATASAGKEGRFWAAVALRVMRRPVLSLVLSVAVLGAVAAPVFDLSTSRLGVSTLPERFEARQGYDLLLDTFGYGNVFPTRIVVRGTDRRLVRRVERAVRADPRFGRLEVEVSPDRQITLVEAPLAGDPLGADAFDAVRDLRARLPDDVLVGGVSAANLDYVTVTEGARPSVFAFVFGVSFLLLLVAFRSIVVPVKAILLNLLSVGAAYGGLVLVFQKGVGNELLGLTEAEAVEVWVPVFLFSVLFGLSMDYHVFLLSRIRERFVVTGDNERAVAFGIGTTGRMITGAALIIIVVFCGFALGDVVMFQQMGFGVALALLLDATLIRSVVVPAAMKLLGEWNWYLPRWLEWLPHLQVEPAGESLSGGIADAPRPGS